MWIRPTVARTANMFMVLDVHRSWRKVKVTDRRAAEDYAELMRELVESIIPMPNTSGLCRIICRPTHANYCAAVLGSRPNFTPLAFARALPSLVPAMIRDRSNSAIPARNVSISRP